MQQIKLMCIMSDIVRLFKKHNQRSVAFSDNFSHVFLKLECKFYCHVRGTSVQGYVTFNTIINY